MSHSHIDDFTSAALAAAMGGLRPKPVTPPHFRTRIPRGTELAAASSMAPRIGHSRK